MSTATDIASDVATGAGYSAAEQGVTSGLGRLSSMGGTGALRTAGSFAARIGLRALPAVGIAMLAYDLGDLASQALSGKSLSENASSLSQRFLSAKGNDAAKGAPDRPPEHSTAAPKSHRATIIDEVLTFANAGNIPTSRPPKSPQIERE